MYLWYICEILKSIKALLIATAYNLRKYVLVIHNSVAH